MRTRNAVLSSIVFLAVVLPAVALPWPEAHSGAYLGVQMKALTPEGASALKLKDSAGAIITYVDQDGPACHAGLLENDVVVAFNGSKVDGPAQLQGLIHTSPPMKPVTLTIVRNGQRKDVQVMLGSWNAMSHASAVFPSALGAPAPPRAYAPDVEIPSYMVVSARHGLVVESLSPQLADFFGSGRGRGVLVRSVEAGSPAAAAGIKAGDVIVKVNNQDVHDMVDWQRGMQAKNNKVQVSVWRDKHEQTLIMNLPGTDDNSRLRPGDWLNFDADALQKQMAEMRPRIERSQEMLAQLEPSEKEMEQMRRDIEKSMKASQKDFDKMSRELAKSSVPTQKEMEKMREQIQKSMPSQKDFDEMSRQLQLSLSSQKDFDEMTRKAMVSAPSQKELDDMRQQIEDSMKNWTPQLQQEMQDVQKQMEQQKQQLQQMLKDFHPSPEN
jgi:serine protease Do